MITPERRVAEILRRWYGIGFDKQMTQAREIIKSLTANTEPEDELGRLVFSFNGITVFSTHPCGGGGIDKPENTEPEDEACYKCRIGIQDTCSDRVNCGDWCVNWLQQEDK